MTTIADISAEEIARTAKETGFSGVVSLAPLRTGPSLDLMFGLADRANRIPNNAGTRFAMASGCKIFTAIAVGLLIEEGRIALDTRLADCVRSREFHFAPEITIGQLLNHTSGVPDYFGEEAQSDYAALWRERPCYGMTSTRDFLPLFENGAMKAPPGSGFLYSNSGFILLGLVVEELTGRDFRDFVADRVFRACGMMRSGYFAMDALPENTAYGYLSQAENEWRTNIFSVPSIGGPDGGAFTTAGDMRLFWTSLLAGRVLSRETIDRFVAPSVRVMDGDDSLHYGYGVWLRKQRGNWIVSVEGGDPGASMESLVWLSDGLIVTVLSNTEDGAWTVARTLIEKINAG
ncbi:MAG: serine hydrolase domain-containing protein [Dongiaceae bacterium]